MARRDADGRPGGTSLHRTASADLADHPVPDGREEDWRFTPLRRLRGLLERHVARRQGRRRGGRAGDRCVDP
jgi:hypothetical protein